MSNQRSLRTRRSKKGRGVNLGLIFTLAALVAVVFGTVLYLLVIRPHLRFSSTMKELPKLTRDLDQPAPPLGLDKYFDPTSEEYQFLLEGNGLSQPFSVTFQGREIYTDKVEIKRLLKEDEGGGEAVRTRQIEDGKTALDEAYKKFGVYVPQSLRYVFILDDTDGVDKEYADKATDIVNRYQAFERAGKGDEVTVSFAMMSDTDYAHQKLIHIPRLASAEELAAVKTAFQEDMKSWSAISTKTSTSSVVLGLFNIVRENTNTANPNETVQVIMITDCIENDPKETKVSWYDFKDPTKFDRSTWPAFDEKFRALLKDQKYPALKGWKFDFYAPPSAAKNSTLVKRCQEYVEHLLTDFCNAKTDSHLGG